MQGDILSDVLGAVRLSGAIFFEVDVAAPWVAAAPPSRHIRPKLLPEAEHLIEYHVVVEGDCWARVTNPEGEAIQLSPGSVVIFPHGDTHLLGSDPDLRAEPDLGNFDQASRAVLLPVRLDYRGERKRTAHLLCGFLGCETTPFNPLVASLPRILHVEDAYMADALLGHLIDAAVDAAASSAPGSRAALGKLSELIFIEAIRRHAQALPEGTGGWLAAVGDLRMGHAIRLLHDEPLRNWTLETLAREVGVSRSVLAERFGELVGMPPMTYLVKWRMQRAASLLKDEAMPLARVAVEAGYQSDEAFSRAFKRATGLSPSQWRKRRETRT